VAFALRDQLDRDQAVPNPPSMSTLLSHAGLSMHTSQEGGHNQPLSPPIELATTYERPPDGNYGENGLIYSRSCNPTRKLLQDAIGQLETAGNVNIDSLQHCNMPAPSFAFSSGMAAIASLILAHKSPVKLLIPQDVYHGVPTQLIIALNDHGVQHQAVDMTNCDALEHIVKEEVASRSGGSLMVWMETPSNPLCQVTNILDVCEIVGEVRLKAASDDGVRITAVVDSTWAPPCITQPLLVG
jgi:cystathionine beta-lyase/cystathionine gamma-synthase